MSKGSAPKIPKPAQFPSPTPPSTSDLVRQQQQENIRAQGTGAINQTSPLGQAEFSRDAAGNITGQRIDLDPTLQPLFGGAAGAAKNYLGQLPQSAFSLSDVPQGMDLQSNFYNQQLGLLQPGFEEQLRDFEVRAAERGLPIGSESFDAGLSPILRAQNQAKQQAAYGAVQLTPQEEQRQIQNALLQRQLPFQEAGQALGLLNQVPLPNLAPQPGQQAPVNTAGIGLDIFNAQNNQANQQYQMAMNQYNQQANQYQQQQAALGSIIGAGAGMVGTALGGPLGGALGTYLTGKALPT